MSITAEAFAEGTGTPLDADTGSVTRALKVSLHHIAPEAWDQAIRDFEDVSQEQLYAFAHSRWPGVAQEPVVFEAGGEVVGGCLVMVQKLPLGVGGIAIAKWGPMVRKLSRPDAAQVYLGMIDMLVREYAQQRRLMISIWPNSAVPGGIVQYDHLMARGFTTGAALAFPNRYIVNLALDEAEQRKSLHQKWRYHLNKSEKAGLSFEHGAPDRLPEFDALYKAMTDRKKFPDHSAYETVPGLMALDVPELRPELFFVRHEGEVVAGAIIFKSGERAVYLYGATNDRALPLRAGYFMHWHIINWLRANTSARWYDLGGTDGFHGLHQFKKGMAGDAGIITPVPPVSNYAAHFWPRLIGTSAYAGRDLIQRARRKLETMRPGWAAPDQKQNETKSSTAGDER